MADIATRVYNHTWKIDPIVRSVLDTDFYKLLMAQTIFRRHRDVQVTFGIHQPHHAASASPTSSTRASCASSSTTSARLSPHARRVHLAARQHLLRQAADVLAGLHGLAREPSASRNTCSRSEDGQYELTFHGPWIETTMWEIPALADPERAALARRPQGHGQVRAAGALCPRHDAGVGEDRAPQDSCPTCRISDFGTRRRHGFLWQDWCVQAMIEGLGAVVPRHLELPDRACAARWRRSAPTRTSCRWSMRRWPTTTRSSPRRPIGCWPTGRRTTRATCASSCPTPTAPRTSSSSAPDWVASWTGIRIDSKDPIEGGEEAIDWWRQRGQDPQREARDLLRRARRRRDRAHPPPFPRPRAHRLRLGHAAHQRLPRACAGRRASTRSPSSAR